MMTDMQTTLDGEFMAKVRKWQEANEPSSERMAARLNMTGGALSLLYRGIRRPGVEFLSALAANVPALRADVAKYLRERGRVTADAN